MLSRIIPFVLLTALSMSGTAMAAGTLTSPRTGQYTYAGPGTVNTHWVETPGGGLAWS